MMRILSSFAAAWFCLSTAAFAADPPDVYMQTYLKRIANGELSLAYTALPKKQQADIRGLIKEFADHMDGELYNGVFRSLSKTCRVLKEKKEFFLNSAILKAQPPEKLAQQAKYWDPLVNQLTRVSRSQINSLEGLKETDPAAFLVDVVDPAMKTAREIILETGPAVGAIVKSFDELKFAVISNGGKAAVLKQIAPKEKEEELKVVLVEEMWLPAELVEQWDAKIAEVKEAIAKFEIKPEQKQLVLLVCGTIDQSVDQMLKAQTQAEFDEAFQTIGAFVLQAAGGAPATPR